MTPPFPIDPASPTPIWSQIEQAVRRLVASGALTPGDAVPSVRECATTLRINPATVSKAYQRLVDAGMLEIRRGEGTFVANGIQAASRSARMRELRDAAKTFVAVALPLGADIEEATAAVQQVWTAMQGRRAVKE